MPTVNISLPSPVADWVEEKVRSGEYASASDYVADLVRLDLAGAGSQSSPEEYQLSEEEARDLELALTELDRGDFAPDAEIAELHARFRK